MRKQGKILVNFFGEHTVCTFENILFWTFGQILPVSPNCFALLRPWIQRWPLA